MDKQRTTRRAFLRGVGITAAGALLAACSPKVVTVEKEVQKEREVTRVFEKVLTPTAAPAKQMVTIRFQEKAPVQSWVERLVIPVFEDKYPWIKVVFEPRVDGWIDKNLTMMAGGTAPDIIHAWGEVFQKYTSKGQMLDLNPLIESDMPKEDVEDQHPVQWKALFNLFKNVRFALPRQVDMQILYFNKALFDKKGVSYPTEKWTYDDWADASRRVVFKDGAGKITTYGCHSWLDSWTFMSTRMNAFGGHVRDEETWMKCRLSEAGAKAATKWVRERIFDDKSWLNTTLIQGLGQSGDSAGMFASELYSMMEVNLNSIGETARQAKFKWDIMHVPTGPGGRFGLGDNDGFGIYKGVAKKGNDMVDACWKFTRFMNGPFFQRVNMEQTGECPGRRSLMQEYQAVLRSKFPALKDVNLDVVTKAFDMGYLVPGETFRYQADAQPIIDAAMQRIWEVGDASVEILDKVCQDVNAAQQKAYAADPDK